MPSNLDQTLDRACVNVFGQSFLFTPMLTGASQPVKGIIQTGVEIEDRAPGDGSIYARLWLPAADISPAPVNGDEIANAAFVYKIVRLEEDAGGGLWLLLRQDREVL